jgi:short-subunit dehydrogenase
MTTQTPDTARPLALVTGASSGIGFELARQFAEHDFDVVIVAEDDGIHTAADTLRATGAGVSPHRIDLRSQDGVEELWTVVSNAGRPLSAAALNAGVGRGGEFTRIPLEDDLEVVDVNVRSTVHLAKRVIADMRARDEGRVLFTSSIASTMPGTYQAVYNASKSFVQSFAEALQEELKDTSVTVTSLMPGPTDTNFFDRAEMDETPVGQGSKDDPAQVAEQGFNALMKGEKKLTAGSLKTKAQGAANKVLPDSVKAKAHAAMAKPESDEAAR